MFEIDRYKERGDAPAQNILRSNSHSRAIRKAAETQEELEKIKERVIRVSKNFMYLQTKKSMFSKFNIDDFLYSRPWILMI